MNSEYSMKISLSPHLHDNKEKPYYWCVLKFDSEWHQIACGWEASPDACYRTIRHNFTNLFSP